MENLNLREEIEQADFILVGLGDEFDHIAMSDEHKDMIKFVKEQSQAHYIPLINYYYNENTEVDGFRNFNDKIVAALNKLCMLLKDKNYYIVSTSINDVVANVEWKDQKIVRPCGGCESLQNINPMDNDKLYSVDRSFLDVCYEKLKSNTDKEMLTTICGENLVFNNVYADKYNENCYIDDWNKYTKWLQYTLNKKVLILELGVGMQFPSVIRWPFEKIVFYNNKAKLIRVNEMLYQLSEDISSRGISIKKNAIEWLMLL